LYWQVKKIIATPFPLSGNIKTVGGSGNLPPSRRNTMPRNRDIAAIQPQTGIEPVSVPESLSAEWFERRVIERRDISKYLHDTLAQDLVVLAFALEKLRYSPHVRPSADLDQAIGMAERCCQDLRTLNVSLSAPLAEEASLGMAIQWYAQRLRVEAGLNIELGGAESMSRGRTEVRDLFLEALHEWAGKAILEGRREEITRILLA